jgi:hypothetical protein
MSTARANLKARSALPTSLEFFGRLTWLDGRPLLRTIEP